MTTDQAFEQYHEACVARVETALERWLPADTIAPRRLHAAMRYSVLGDGKRVRPLLVYATGQALGAEPEQLDGAACAVELIHAYSLVHDDLPAMDDDDLRRGRPTCHRAYDEATAVLTGDALQTLAFHVLLKDQALPVAPDTRLEMLNALAIASGSRGMAGGQALDLDAVGADLDLAELENMHIHKTGALIHAAVKLGVLATGSDQRQPGLEHYANCIGLAFQIQDDVLDVTSNTETLGKTGGKDAQAFKPTYTSLLGIEGARSKAEDLIGEALSAIRDLGQHADQLRDLARFIVERDK